MNLEDVIAHYGSGRSLAFAIKTTPQAVSHWRKIGYIPFAKQLVIEKISSGLFKAEDEDKHSRFATSKYFK
jgi:hypothetical protein